MTKQEMINELMKEKAELERKLDEIKIRLRELILKR